MPKKGSRVRLFAGLATVVIALGVAAEAWLLFGYEDDTATDTGAGPVAEPVETPSQTPTPTPSEPAFDKTALSIDDPASIWVVVNKTRPLNPQDYAPADLVEVPVKHTNAAYLRKEAADALVAMFQAFQAETGLEMESDSAYRSYAAQVSVYGNWSAAEGQESADTHSARPGYSEHQTGLAVDIGAYPSTCAVTQCFADTPQSAWLAEHAWEYGWILRYQQDKVDVTGYIWEPWHYRYVGKDLAAEMHVEGVTTLEEFFGLPAAPDYLD